MNRITQDINNILVTAVRDAFPGQTVEPELVPTKKKEHGDYTTNIAMQLAKPLGRPPREIAETVVACLKHPHIEQAEIAGPGFINLRISDVLYKEFVATMLDASYFELPKTGHRMIVEFVSANPTGPLNVVSARAAAVGDTLVRMNRYAGHEVHAEYYVNDYGNQVRLLGESLLVRWHQLKGEDAALREDHYQGGYLVEIAKEMSLRESEFKDLPAAEQTAFASAFGVETILQSHIADLETYGVRFDRWFRETELHRDRKTFEALEILVRRGHVFEQDGKKWFRSTTFGDEKDRVVLREDGTPTYVLPDIAYHYAKMQRGFDRIVDILGPDHHGYIPRLRGGMLALGFPADAFTVLIVQQVNLIENGEKVKMSKRLGKLILMRELVEEVGTDCARYFLLQRNLASHLDFDLTLAKKHNDENPVYYIQYVHARIASILRQAGERGIRLSAVLSPAYTFNDSEKELVKALVLFNDEVTASAANNEPNITAHYLHRLAGLFHKFYNDSPVLNESDPAVRDTRYAILLAVREAVSRGLGLLGISAPETM